jgi:ribosomal protein L12E/L44/L45/RPP1/RPP2
MTTFTTEDRILAEKDGSFTINVENGTVTTRFKDLTDKEIDELIMEVAEKPTDEDLYDFAKAILKKARE